jgi:hypothetical protein
MESSQFNQLICRITDLDKKALELLLFAKKCNKAVGLEKQENNAVVLLGRGLDLTMLKSIRSGYKSISDEIKKSNSNKLIEATESILLQEACLKLGRRMTKLNSQVHDLLK